MRISAEDKWIGKMETRVIRQLKEDDLVVFASLPDMGRVGGIVSSFLAKSLGAEAIAEFVSEEKPWVSFSDGVVNSVRDTYTLSYDKVHRALIFSGESQPQDPIELHRLCNALLELVQSVGKVRRLYAAGGYLRDQVTGAPRVGGVVNRPELRAILASSGIEPVGNEITTITWFNGLILGKAAERGIDGIGLFGEIAETTVPQPLAAKSIISAFSRMEGLKIDTKGLDQEYESVLEDIQKKKEPSKYGPGIG